MTKYNGELFADFQIESYLLNVKIPDGETEIDLMPLLLKKDFNYLFKTRINIFGNSNETILIINGIEYKKSYGILYLENVLIESIICKSNVNLDISYCL